MIFLQCFKERGETKRKSNVYREMASHNCIKYLIVQFSLHTQLLHACGWRTMRYFRQQECQRTVIYVATNTWLLIQFEAT